jgi:uncharacterized repeat protein (TIGR01451 family)
MKRRLLVPLVLLLSILFYSTEKTSAQITGVSVDSLMNFAPSICSVPDSAQLMIMGHASGTLALNDSVELYVNFGDGSDSTFMLPLYQNQGYFWSYIWHVYQIPGTFTVMTAASTPNGFTDTAYANALAYTNSCANLSGDLYIDGNSNCVKDAGESIISWRSLTITGGGVAYYAFADMTGHYSINLPTGTSYTVTPNVSSTNLTPACPASGSTTVTLSSTPSTADFAFNCSATNADYSVNLFSSNFRPGYIRTICVYSTSNSACGLSPATVTVTLPPELTYQSTVASYPAPTASGSTLTWTTPPFNTFNSFVSYINVLVDPNAVLGDTLCVTAVVSTTPPDANPANNSATICKPVSNSLDPNDKEVSPIGSGSQGYILNGTPLTYLINFQNTGNDVAYNVTVKDMIDNDLDLSTMRVMKASHPVQVAMVGNEANFRFDNINLPDSAANEPASHGYIIYAIMPKANLAVGTQIDNTADIYFDYNAAIVTNTTVNTIGTAQSVQQISSGSMSASIYPNPANETVFVTVKENGGFKAQLFDIMGRTVRETTTEANNVTINVRQLSAGMYFLRLTNADNKVLTTKINVTH